MSSSNYSAMQTLNTGFKMAYGKYILVLDDDVELIQNTTISKLVDDAELYNAQLVGCRVITNKGGFQQLEYKYPLNEIIDPENIGKKPFKVYDFIGACVLIDRNAFKEIGFYDESLFIYWNESDTTLKLMASGYNTILDPTITPVHYNSISKRNIKRGWFYFVRNGNIIINRFLPIRSRILLIPLRTLMLIIDGAFWFKDPVLISKVVFSSIKSFINIFYMPSRITDFASDQIKGDINDAYSFYHIRKIYEWLFKGVDPHKLLKLIFGAFIVIIFILYILIIGL
jgi:hypothetical protein